MDYVLDFLGLPTSDLQNAESFVRRAFLHVRDHFIPSHRNNYHPHVLGHRALGLFSMLLISVKIFSLAVISFGPAEEAFSSAINTQNIISLTNVSRVSFGLNQLTFNSKLEKAAQAKADDMLQKGYFAHTAPDGKTPWDFIANAGYNYISAGENLAVNFSEAEDVETAWMNSPGHKANILNKNFEEIGIGVSQGQYQGHNAIFVVQMFGSEAAQNIALSDKPTALLPPKPSSLTAEAPAPKSFSPVKIEPAKALETLPLASVSPEPALQIGQTSFSEENGSLKLSAIISGQPVKVLAKFGRGAVMLLPRSDGSWAGDINLNSLTVENSGLVLEAQDIKGFKAQMPVAAFSGSTQENFNPLPQAAATGHNVSFLGRAFDPKNFENKFYLIFAAALLGCLILAIGIRRHIQHVSLIANASLVVVLAIGLWLG